MPLNTRKSMAGKAKNVEVSGKMSAQPAKTKNSFKCLNCGECCGLIPLLEQEFIKLHLAVLELPLRERVRVKKQKRHDLMCPLRDIENKKCLVYEHRPWLCRNYGHLEGLVCPYNRRVKVRNGFKELEKYLQNKGGIIGTMGLEIGWRELERG